MKKSNKILAMLKATTSFNSKIILLTITLVGISLFSIRFINYMTSNNSELTSKIIKNESRLLDLYDITTNISRVDDEILSKCLDRNKNYDSLTYDVREMYQLKDRLPISDSISLTLDSLMYEKVVIFNSINDFNFNDSPTKKYVSVVSTNVRKSLFRKTKTEHTIVTKSYDYVDTSLNRKNYANITTLISINNILTMKMHSILDTYSKEQVNLNKIEYVSIYNDIKLNMRHYLMGLLVLIVLYVVVIYLLISDIKKKNRSENRDKYIISMLIDSFTKK